jgi:glycosyltransferase involved in cell wall biosynthesis
MTDQAGSVMAIFGTGDKDDEGEYGLAGSAKCLAILPWGNEVEDYLDPLHLTLEDFCERMDGGWLFGIASALMMKGWTVIIVVVSARAAEPTQSRHIPTGAKVIVLPSSTLYRTLRARAPDPYGGYEVAMFRPRVMNFPVLRTILSMLLNYTSTPVCALRRAMRAERCSALLVQEYEYARFDVLACLGRMMKIPVFATFQGGRPTARRFEAWLRPLTIRLGRRFLIASEVEAHRVKAAYGVQDNDILSCPNPVDLAGYAAVDRTAAREALALPSSRPIAVTHCRIAIGAKGLDVLLDAWRIVLAEAKTQPLLLIVGDGPDADRLSTMIDQLPPGTVRWHREFVLDRARLCRFLSAADVYVMASRQEGFAVAPLEAMASGLPIVACDAPGIPDLIHGGSVEFGRMVPRGDAAALAGALVNLLEDVETCRQLGRAALHEAERYALGSIGNRIDAMLSGGTA